MLRFRLMKFVVPVLLSFCIVLVVSAVDASAQNKNNADHVILVLPRDGECATIPDTLRGVKEDQTIAFFAVPSEIPGDVKVSGLKSKPKNRENGIELTDTKEEKIKKGTLSKKLKIKTGARGFYEYTVQCGDVDDAPPVIIVD